MTEKKTLKEKLGYSPDKTLSKNPKAVGIILACILIPPMIGLIAAVQAGDGWGDEDAANFPEDIYDIQSVVTVGDEYEYDDYYGTVDSEGNSICTGNSYHLPDGIIIEMNLVDFKREFGVFAESLDAEKVTYGKNTLYRTERDVLDDFPDVSSFSEYEQVKAAEHFYLGMPGEEGIVRCDIYTPDGTYTNKQKEETEKFLTELHVQ